MGKTNPRKPNNAVRAFKDLPPNPAQWTLAEYNEYYEGHGKEFAHLASRAYIPDQLCLLNARSFAPVWSRTRFIPAGSDYVKQFSEVTALEALGWAHNSFGDDAADSIEEMHKPLTIACAVALSCYYPKAVVVAKKTIHDLIFLPPTGDPSRWEVADEVMTSSDTRGALGGLVFRCTVNWNETEAEGVVAKDWLARRRGRRRGRRWLNRGGALPESNAYPSVDYVGYAFYMWITERAEIIYESVPPMRTEDGKWLRGEAVVAKYGLEVMTKTNSHAKKEMRQGFAATLKEWNETKSAWRDFGDRCVRLSDVLSRSEMHKLEKIIHKDSALAMIGLQPKENAKGPLKIAFESPTKPYVDTSVILNPNGINGFSFHWGGQCLSYNGVVQSGQSEPVWALFTEGSMDGGSELGPKNGLGSERDLSVQVGIADCDPIVTSHASFLTSLAGSVYARVFHSFCKAKMRLHALEQKHNLPPLSPPSPPPPPPPPPETLLPGVVGWRERLQKHDREAADVALVTLAKRVVRFVISDAIDAALASHRRDAAQRLVDLRALNAGVKARAQLRYDAKEREERERARAALTAARAARRAR